GKAAIRHEVAYETLVRREVAKNPTAAMHKDKCWQDSFASRRADDREAHFQSVLRDRLCLDVAGRQIELNRCLSVHQDFPRFGRRHGFHWFPTAGIECFEEL